MANRELLLGDEALALGALHAGLSGVYAYPGTPSTEITEYIQNHPLAAERNVHCKWSANEKTAMEEALGMSFCGKRALVCMKHVGMNVAADAFVNSGMTGANGGLVVVAADDPSMHSSQNEQDSRFYGKFAFIPVFEPSTQQETYDMVRYAFDYSERFHIPVLMRLTTRMAHSRAVVETAPAREPNAYACPAPERMRQWVLMPGNSRVRYNTLLEEYARFEEEAAASRFNTFRDGADRSRGIIACGIAYNYLMENYPDGCPHPVLKIAQYPLPRAEVRRLASQCDSLLVIEEGQPLVEEQLRGILETPLPIRGRMSGELPRTGELTPDSVRRALGLEPHEAHAASQIVVPRPPALCQGCGHRDMYTALTEVVREYDNARWLLHAGLACAVPRHRHLRGDGRIDHHGQRRRRCGPASLNCRHRRLDLHPLGHDRSARRRKRTGQHHGHHLRQPHHGHDGRTGLGRNGPSGADLRRHRRRSGPHPRRGAPAAQPRGAQGDDPRGDRLPGRLGDHPAPGVHPDRQTPQRGQNRQERRINRSPVPRPSSGGARA